jgi:transcriptional regulator with XRE-family HTH domain
MDRPPATFQVDGAAIRTRRKELGMTQLMCAAAADISRSYLAEIESGHREHMRPPTYAGLRTALQIQPQDEQLLTPPQEQHRKEPDGRHEGAPRPHPQDPD